MTKIIKPYFKKCFLYAMSLENVFKFNYNKFLLQMWNTFYYHDYIKFPILQNKVSYILSYIYILNKKINALLSHRLTP